MSEESAKAEKRASFWMKITFRVVINVGVVWVLREYFSDFFLISSGLQPLALVGITFAILNMLVVPVLHVLSLPIKMFAWVIAFILVNTIAVWLSVLVIDAINLGVTLSIEGGILGWLIVGTVFGIGNWIVKAVLK